MIYSDLLNNKEDISSLGESTDQSNVDEKTSDIERYQS